MMEHVRGKPKNVPRTLQTPPKAVEVLVEKFGISNFISKRMSKQAKHKFLSSFSGAAPNYHSREKEVARRGTSGIHLLSAVDLPTLILALN